eukprot:TRINITY_DN1522_c0_g1_i4.p1 TRINITY_DN1522_c0_g1~~TRINITY_DN1522_c0_g1_i4.p1  ORF type:complete len:484 (-),score=114.65 TRINITY_DN1522_c0_g1_i4:146-1597(-)
MKMIFFFQAEDGIRDAQESRGLGDVYKRQLLNIIKAENNKDLYLVFDYMETDLHAVIRANILESIHKKYVIYQTLKALKFIHTGELIHRDLKPSNILLNSECLVKLADFGLARSLAASEDEEIVPILTEYVATRWYRAPEILLGSTKYTKAVDMWSVGCILGEMLFGRAIFPGTSTLNQIERVLELTGKPKPEDIESLNSSLANNILSSINLTKKRTYASFFPNATEDEIDFIRRCLIFNPSQRMTVEQALKHRYVAEFSAPDEEISCDHIIKISMDDNKKFTIKEYREALYEDIAAKKKEQRRKLQQEYLSQLGVGTSIMLEETKADPISSLSKGTTSSQGKKDVSPSKAQSNGYKDFYGNGVGASKPQATTQPAQGGAEKKSMTQNKSSSQMVEQEKPSNAYPPARSSINAGSSMGERPKYPSSTMTGNTVKPTAGSKYYNPSTVVPVSTGTSSYQRPSSQQQQTKPTTSSGTTTIGIRKK